MSAETENGTKMGKAKTIQDHQAGRRKAEKWENVNMKPEQQLASGGGGSWDN